MKEVDKRYLCPSLYATYDRHDDNLLKQVYLVTSIDDQNYQKVGFKVVNTADGIATPEQEVVENRTVYNQVQVMRRASWSSPDLVLYHTYDLDDFFPDLAGEDGLLNVQKYSDYRDGNGTLAPGYEYTVQPYFVTPDSVKVTGMKIRYVYLGNGRYTADGGLHVADEETFSTTEVYTQPSAARTLSLRSTFFISWDADEDVVEPEIVITKVDGGEVTSQTVEAGDQTGKIGYSEKDGYYFAGWFLDEALNVPADFSNVEESMTVYAKYISASDLRILVSVQGKHARDYDLSLSAQSGCQFAQAGFLCSFQGGTEDAQAGVDEDGLFSAIWSVSGLKNKSAFSVTPYWVTLDGTPVYAGQADYMLQGNSIVSK